MVVISKAIIFAFCLQSKSTDFLRGPLNVYSSFSPNASWIASISEHRFFTSGFAFTFVLAFSLQFGLFQATGGIWLSESPKTASFTMDRIRGSLNQNPREIRIRGSFTASQISSFSTPFSTDCHFFGQNLITAFLRPDFFVKMETKTRCALCK